MNMTAKEFLEEMRVYFAGEKEAMSTDGLIFTDEVGADIELQVSNLKDCYWEIFESSQATLYRLSSGNEVARYDAVSYKYLDASGWHRSSEITDDIDAAIRMIEGLLYWGEANPVDGNSVEYMEGKPIPNIFNIREDYMHTDEYPSEKEIAKKHLEMLREADERNDIKMPSLSYSNDVDNVEVSMRLAETLKGCYWKTYDDGSGSLRRLQTDTVILGYNLHPVDSGYDEYEDARGWHGFERSEDFRLALETLVTEGIVSPMDKGAKDFDLRSNEFEQEEVRSMNMTPEEFLEEMRTYFAGEKEAMSTDSLFYIDHESGLGQTLLLSGIKGCYWHQIEDEVATLYRLSTGEEMCTCFAGERQEYRDRNGWHSILPDVDAPGESDDPTFNYISYTIEEMMQSLELDIQAGDAIPMDSNIETLQSKLENLTEFEKRQSAKRLFIDMDGTLAEFHPVDTMETLYEQGYFAQLAPHENVVNGIKTFMNENPDAEVFILSSVLTDSPYAQAEKSEWLDRYLPEIGMENRIFVPCGSAKNEFVPGGVRENDVLLDDYSKNLHEWPGQALKLMNGINGTKGSFQGKKISAEMSVAEFAARLASFCEGKESSLQAETEKADIENLSYEDKFKIIIETEFPETKGNEELQESLYSHFMDSTQTGFFDEEIRKEFQDMIGAYDKEQNRTFDFMQKLVSEKNSGFYQEEIETGVDFER